MPLRDNKLDGKWWLKWWTRETLYGSFMIAPLDELGFFLKLCCLCKQIDITDSGVFMASDTEGLSHSAIAGFLQMQNDMDDFERLLQIQKDKGRVIEDNSGIIRIVNYQFFQHDKGKKQSAPLRRPMTPEALEARNRSKVEDAIDYDTNYVIDSLAKRGYRITDEATGETTTKDDVHEKE